MCLSFLVVNPDDRLILDCKAVEVKRVSCNNKDLKWSLYNEHPGCAALGSPLVILFDDDTLNKKENKFTISIDFSTTEDSSAVQWLEPTQTFAKTHPFMFTQCEAILARTLIPCQVVSRLISG